MSWKGGNQEMFDGVSQCRNRNFIRFRQKLFRFLIRGCIPCPYFKTADPNMPIRHAGRSHDSDVERQTLIHLENQISDQSSRRQKGRRRTRLSGLSPWAAGQKPRQRRQPDLLPCAPADNRKRFGGRPATTPQPMLLSIDCRKTRHLKSPLHPFKYIT